MCLLYSMKQVSLDFQDLRLLCRWCSIIMQLIRQNPIPALPFIILQEHAKAEEERVARERQDPRIGDEFLLNVGGEVILLGHFWISEWIVIFEVIDIFILVRYLWHQRRRYVNTQIQGNSRYYNVKLNIILCQIKAPNWTAIWFQAGKYSWGKGEAAVRQGRHPLYWWRSKGLCLYSQVNWKIMLF